VYFFLLPRAINPPLCFHHGNASGTADGFIEHGEIGNTPGRLFCADKFFEIMNATYDFLASLFGLGMEPKELTFVQMSLRGVSIFLLTLVMVRLSSKRSLAEKTAFDAILLVIIASVLSRAINGSAGFFTSIGCSFVLVFLHRLFSWIACRSHAFGKIIKGCPAIVIENGQLQRDAMRRNLISEHDLEEDLRLNARTDDPLKIRTARVERSGDISFIKAKSG
jgi:hypothetical protein